MLLFQFSTLVITIIPSAFISLLARLSSSRGFFPSSLLLKSKLLVTLYVEIWTYDDSFSVDFVIGQVDVLQALQILNILTEMLDSLAADGIALKIDAL